MGTADQIAALKANAEALKEPLRQRYWQIEAERQPLVDQVAALKTERDARIDDLTNAQQRAYHDQIMALQARLEDTRAERSSILKALRDDDGKTRLGEPS